MKTDLLQEIHELVKSLDKTEKRYFKLYSSFQKGDKSYLALFDILDKQTVWDGKIILKKFLLQTQSCNFPAVKKYLFNQLVASIRSYGAYKDLDSDHTDLIEMYKILDYKGLHGQRDRLLNKIKQLTLDDDAFARHFSVLLMEYHKEIFNPEESSADNLIRILQERRHTLNIMDNYLWVGEIFTLQRLHLRKKLYCRSKKDRDELTKIVSPILKTKEADMLSRTALGIRNIVLCEYYLATGHFEKAFYTSKIYLELRKNAGSNDKLDMQTLNEYSQHIVISMRSGFFDGFEENATQFKALIDTIHNKEKYFTAYEKWHNAMIVYYNKTGQFQNGAMFLEKELKKNPDRDKQFSMKSKIMCWYFSAYNLYANRQYNKALQFIQRILTQPGNDLEETAFAKLLMMYIHYDLKNYELLEYQTRSAQRFMTKKERLYKSEKLVLDFLKSVTGADSKRQRQEQLKELQNGLTVLFKTPYEKRFSYYFDIVSWIEASLTGKDFALTVQENNPAK